MIKANKKGFTLIELLAVIIILGVLLLIAVTSVSKYITNSRLKTYETNLLNLISAVSDEVNAHSTGYVFAANEYLIVPIPCIELEKGSNTKSPFGEYIPKNSFVAVTRNYESGTNVPKGYKYYVAALDSSGFGVGLVDPNSEQFQVSGQPKVTALTESVPITNPKTYQLVGEIPSEFTIETNNKTSKLKTCDAYKPGDSLINEKYLVNQTLKNNAAQSDTNIDFSKTSKATGTNGLYYTNKNTEDNKITYYFRGDVNNNYVKFGKDKDGNDMLWRIVRINEDGSVRIINLDNVELSGFNEHTNDNAYVGYMYGTPGSSIYGETHANIVDSQIKKVIDKWYENNLKINYSNYLADAGFCNDRSVAPSAGLWASDDTALGYGKNQTYYGAYNRLVNNDQPQYKCPNESRDLFTTSTSSKGNKSLTYPIGLLTVDEVVYAGGVYSVLNENMYLANSSGFWTMSPFSFEHIVSNAREWYVPNNGYLNYNLVTNDFVKIHPVINLKSTVEITEQLPDGCTKLDGTEACPYIIKTN